MKLKKKNKEPMIACPTCGVENRIASPFCMSCGDRIYKNGAAPSPETTGKKEASSASKAFRSAINSLLFVAIATLLGLAFWPYASVSVPLAQDPGQQVDRYLKVVTEALENQKPVPVARFSERNINAYIGQNNNPDTSKLFGVVLSAPNLELIANEPLGPLNLSTRVLMKPNTAREELAVSEFWIGHLPLPTFWAKPWTKSLSKRFDLKIDHSFWDHLIIKQVDTDYVYLLCQP